VHLGGNKIVSVNSQFKKVDIRCYWPPPDLTILKPTRRGIGLSYEEWFKISSVYIDCTKQYIEGEIQRFVPCYLKADHADGGALGCKECNPSFYKYFLESGQKQSSEKTNYEGRAIMPLTDMIANWRHLPMSSMTLNQLQAIQKTLRNSEEEFTKIRDDQSRNFVSLLLRVEEFLGSKTMDHEIDDQEQKISSIVGNRP
jgi:hypothetical protein